MVICYPEQATSFSLVPASTEDALHWPKTSLGVELDMGGGQISKRFYQDYVEVFCLSIHLLFKLSTLLFQVLKGLYLRKVEGPSENH